MFHLDHSHGYSLQADNGGDTKEVLSTLKTGAAIAEFQSSLALESLRNRTPQRVIIVLGSGMNSSYDGMSVPSQARAEKAADLFQEDTENTIILPTGRFTYRLLQVISGKQEPTSTDAREIGKYLRSVWIPADQILLEEWSNCTFWNAVFTRLLLDAFVDSAARIVVVTSDWALERAQIVFGLLFWGRDISYEVVSGDLSSEDERHRIEQEEIVNRCLYKPSILHYWLNAWDDSLMPSLWYLREINTSTPGNTPDWFALTTTAAVQLAEINPSASYWVK